MKFLKYLSAFAASVIIVSAAALNVSAETNEDTAAELIAEPIVTDYIAETEQDSIETTVSEESSDVSDTEITTAVSTADDETSTTVVTAEPEPLPTPGWNESDDGKTYYYDENGEKYVGYHEIDGNAYYFAQNGAMKTGWYTIEGIRMYFDPETGVRNTGWIDYMNNLYYDDPVLGKLTGIGQVDGETYIFDDNGILYKDWFVYDDAKYYGGETGRIRKGQCDINGKPYLFSNTGRFLSGWQTVNGRRFFYDYETTEIVYGWINYNGFIYYSSPSSGKYTGDRVISGLKYRFTEKGYLVTGLQKFDDGTRYYYKDGTPGRGFIKINGSTYYFDKNTCLMLTGFQAIDGAIYYFDPGSGKMVYDWKTIDGKKYYFDKNGKMQIGLVTINKKIYFFDDTGAMLTGWKTVENKKYYFDGNGVAKTGWQTIDGKKYYFNDKGVMATDFRTLDQKKYYFGSDGVMKTGWQTVKGDKYYFGKNGAAYTGRHTIDQNSYFFYSNGKLVQNGNQQIVEKALSQLGNVGGKPYWTWWGYNFRIEWCACFVSWCANQCGFTQTGDVPEFISCAIGIKWFKDHGQWKNPKKYTPTSGDYIFFDWEPDGVADHVGIVDHCEDGIVYTVEGNSGDKCRQQYYYLDEYCIFGYARPSYQP